MKIYCSHSSLEKLPIFKGDEWGHFSRCRFCYETWPEESRPPQIVIAYSEPNPKEENL